jgi:hypothetical protein
MAFDGMCILNFVILATIFCFVGLLGRTSAREICSTSSSFVRLTVHQTRPVFLPLGALAKRDSLW